MQSSSIVGPSLKVIEEIDGDFFHTQPSAKGFKTALNVTHDIPGQPNSLNGAKSEVTQ